MSESGLIMRSSPVDTGSVAEILPPGHGMVRVATRPDAFYMAGRVCELPAGLTVREMVEAVVPDPAMRAISGVRIAGEEYLPEHWHLIRPKPGTLVEVVAGAGDMGGGEGGKDPLRTVLTIAVIVAAAYTGGLSLGTLSVMGAQISVASLAAAAVSIAGGMLINAIAPPSKPKLPEISGAGSTNRDSPTYDIAGARNQARQFGVVPRVLGEHMIVPPYGALPYTEIVGDDEYLRMLFVWSIGPAKVADRKIGETDLAEFDDVETEFRRGYQASQLTAKGNWDASAGSYPASPVFGDTWTVSVAGTVDGVAYEVGDTIVFNGLDDAANSEAWDRNGDQPLTLFSNDVFQEDLAVELTADGGAEVRTSQAQSDELSIDITFPQGLVYFSNGGARSSLTVQIKVEYSPAGEDDWSNAPDLEGGILSVTAARSSAVRAGHRWTVPRGQYDVRLTRQTADSTDSQTINGCSWTALRSVSSVYPIDCEVGLAVEAVRIKATGQLRGIIDQYRGTVTSILPAWDSGTESWVEGPTRNPGAIFRALLQDAGQARPVADAGVELDDLADWHGKCASRGFAFDGVIDFAASTRELLQDVAAAGGAGVARPGGKWSVTIDEEKPVVQHFTPRNSWGFSASKVFADLPHALRCRFPNRDLDWRQDERIVYRDGYNATNATEYEGFEQFGITDPDHIWVRARESIASGVLRPERYSIKTDPAWLVAQQGSAIRVQHDVILVGLASGRIKSVTDDGAGDATGFVVDEVLEMEEGKSYVLRVQHVEDDGSVTSTVYPIDTEAGGITDPTLTTTIALADAPEVDDLFLFGESGLDSIEGVVLAIRPRDDLSAEIVFVDAAPEIAEAAAATRDFAPADVSAAADTVSIEAHPFHDRDVVQLSTTGTLPAPLAVLTDYHVTGRTADSLQLAATSGGAAIDLTDAGTGTHTITRRIPDFASSITAATALAVPVAIYTRSGGTVLFREPDGSWTSRILITVKKPGGLQTDVDGLEARFRPSGSAGPWESAFSDRGAGEISLMPVEDGVTYEFQLRWTLGDGGAGAWSTLATHTVEGKTAPPSDVTGFSAQQNGNVVTFRWAQIADLDRNGYTLRYTARGSGAGWDDWIFLSRETRGTLVTNAGLPPGDWTVGVKAIDTSGNESDSEATFDIVVANANDIVATRSEDPRWPGAVDGYIKHYVSGRLIPESNSLAADMSDAELWDQLCHDPVLAPTYEIGQPIDLGFDADGVRVWGEVTAGLGPGETGAADAELEIDYRDDAAAYDGWESWTIGSGDFRHLKARLVGNNSNGAASISAFDVTADVIERTETGEDAVVAPGGTHIAFARRFHQKPNVQATADGGAALYPVKSNVDGEGFDLHVFDAAGNDVGGTVDWEATGA